MAMAAATSRRLGPAAARAHVVRRVAGGGGARLGQAMAAEVAWRCHSSTRGFGDAVVVPMPGMLLTNSLFGNGSRLADALGAREADVELGEAAIRDSSSLQHAAEQIVTGLGRRHGPDVRTVLVGHSYGGYAAMEVVRRWPERVAGLVLVSTQSRADTPGASARRRKQIEILKTQGLDAVFEALLPNLLHGTACERPALVDLIRTMANAIGAEAFERQVRACIARSDQRETLRTLPSDIPICALNGKEDKVTPPQCLREIRELLLSREASADTEILGGTKGVAVRAAALAPWCARLCEGTGHLAPLERPETFHGLLSEWAAQVHRAQQVHPSVQFSWESGSMLRVMKEFVGALSTCLAA
mmetsp:Transcript_68125/g.197456  ORF Transcript_68125/g.197456 Transcript_68125/m.197456 type:complete len:359 (-) Transcript_68125:127-1203(-)